MLIEFESPAESAKSNSALPERPLANIMVFDVAAESVGALSILHDFHRDVVRRAEEGKRWFFVLGRTDLPESASVRVLRFPWVKKSWFHRLFFDWFVAPRLVKKYEIDEVLSLQNLTVPRVLQPQTVYLHQSLPFSEYRFSFFAEPLLWTYQNIIGRMILRSIKKADAVIVQTKWMKTACMEKTGCRESKFTVAPPEIVITPQAFFSPSAQSLSTFFYPASPFSYKNHKIILEACKILEKQGEHSISVLFTLSGSENRISRELLAETKRLNLPIKFLGPLSRGDVFNYYSQSVLLFPSYIETFGLPLLEARVHGSFVLASNCPFSHEILDGYERTRFFDPSDAEQLASEIREIRA
jgi:glycosyltransferase involved in cell wall biosynthesis